MNNMHLIFQLSMPGCPSWNGRWSGEGKLYAIVKSFSTQKAKTKAQEFLAKGYFSYGWSDGWRASIEVKECDAAQARTIRSKSAGFCGYEWMVESILVRGKILADHEVQADEDRENEARERMASIAPLAIGSPAHKSSADSEIF